MDSWNYVKVDPISRNYVIPLYGYGHNHYRGDVIMSFFNNFKNDKNDDRSHQDNCLYSEIDSEKWDNGNYQFCRF